MDLTNEDLTDNIHDALIKADCWHEPGPNMPDADGNDIYETTAPHIWAVVHHCSGDIWVITASKAEGDTLTSSVHKWLLKLSDGLTFVHKTYPVLIYGIPASFDTSHNSLEIHTLLGANSGIILHLSSLQQAEFLIHSPDQLHQKMHSSIVLHFTDLIAVNECIANQVSFWRQLCPTTKFIHSLLSFCYVPCQTMSGPGVRVVSARVRGLGFLWMWLQ